MTECRFYFYIYTGDEPAGQRLAESDMMVVAKCVLEAGESESLDDMNYRNRIKQEYNSRLRDFLIASGIKHFIPKCPPSFDKTEECVSVCYYHNKPSYDIIYGAYDTGYIMAPNGYLMFMLDELYESHLLNGWYDHRANTLLGDDDALV